MKKKYRELAKLYHPDHHTTETLEKEIVEVSAKSNTTHESVEVRLEGLTKIFVDKTKKEIEHKIFRDITSYLKKGDVLGYMGTTGNSTGNHVHFEVRINGSTVNPYDYVFNGDEEAAEAFEAEHLDEITDRMVEQAGQLGVEPRKMLSHVLDYRFFVENGEILNRAR